MKQLFFILCLFPSLINAQNIDFNNFDEKKMDKAIFTRMNDYSSKEAFYSIIRDSTVSLKVYKFIKKNNEKLPLDDLSAKIGGILLKHNSRLFKRTNLIGSIGITDTVKCDHAATYQEIADRCFKNLSEPDNSFFIGWSKTGDAITYFNEKTMTVYISFIYLD